MWLCTTQMQAAPTSWVDQSPECTRPSCPRLQAALHPIVAPSSNSTLSNVRPMPTTLLKARLGNNQPLPHSMAECHRPTKVISILKSGGYHPTLNIMDNECSAVVDKYIQSKAINIQFIPPHNHQANATKCASPHSRNTSSPPSQTLICFASSNSGMNFSRRSNLP
jgi:hypothetical protein